MMEITCPSCSTVYNVGAEQLTDKGVNFRCSQCEFVFKVRKHAKDPTGPIKVQRISAGDLLAYDEMADVQRDIVEGKLSRRDQLSERGGAWTELGQLKSLSPFFAVVERSSKSDRAVESTQDQPTVTTSTRAFSPVAPWEDEAKPDLPPRTNISDSAFAGAESRKGRSGTATFAPLDEESLEQSYPAAEVKTAPVSSAPASASRPSSPDERAAEQRYFEEGNFGSKPTSVYDDDDDLSDYEKKISGGGAGRSIIALLLFLILGVGVAALFFRDEIGATKFGSQLPYFGEAGQRDEPPQNSQVAANSNDGTAETDRHDTADSTGAAAALAADEQDARSDSSSNRTEADAEAELDTQDGQETRGAEARNDVVGVDETNNNAPSAVPQERNDREQAAAADSEPEAESQNDEDEDENAPVTNIQDMSAAQAKRHGRRALSRGNSAAAIAAFERAASLESGNFDTQVKLGQAYQAAGDSSGAHRAYSSALRANPRYMPALFGIADVERSTGRRADAIERYRTILRISQTGDRADQARNALRGLGASAEGDSDETPAAEAPAAEEPPEPAPAGEQPPEPAPASEQPTDDEPPADELIDDSPATEEPSGVSPTIE